MRNLSSYIISQLQKHLWVLQDALLCLCSKTQVLVNMVMLIVLFLCTLIQTISSAQRNASLESSSDDDDDIFVVFTPNSTFVASTNSYNIALSTDETYDIQLKLANDWTFKSNIPTTLQLTIYGSLTSNLSTNNSLMIIFSVGQDQYFSFVVNIEFNNLFSKIYPKSI